jgi:putative hydrolase of the HAD superfamily
VPAVDTVGVVFDLGGVVLRWQPREFLPRLLPSYATDAESTRALMAGIFQSFGGDWAEFDRGALDAKTLATRIATRTGIPASEAARLIDAIPDELQPLPETLALIDHLHAQGTRLFFLSNMPAPYADLLEARHAFFSRFEFGLFSARVGCIKPDPAIFTLAQTRFGLPASQLLFIDDVQHNVDAARAVGWRAIRFESAERCRDEIGMLLKL